METQLIALTPPRGRGKRQSTAEATCVEAIATVLTTHRVEGVLQVAWEKQSEWTTPYVGLGSGAASCEKRVIAQTRSHITRIDRQGAPIAVLVQRFGWKAFVSNAGQARRSWTEAVVGYRNAYRVERLSNRQAHRGADPESVGGDCAHHHQG